MDVAIVTNAVVAAVSVITVGVSAFFALRQLRLSQGANHTLVAIELLTRDRMSDAFLDSQQYLLTELRTACPPGMPVSELPADARKHVNRIALYYNGLGQMLAFQVVEPALLLGTGGFRAREAWAVLEPYILAERAARGESYLSNFEHLAVLATETPWPVAVRKLGLRRFDRYPADVGLPPEPGPGRQPGVDEEESST
ncbi:hypothetical protein [Micromonospora sp. WMMD975]|uniref:DUF4760 domain-containing protein n=1 Tax=Micromonospora sp. WMMD975 TaxID=3016087 RepID=UPI00249A89DC|nr:hypothetical protein [Micromonospora sp. WMMD975]WFE34083.1 hypothetical protein O7613_01405 [Micromonospora sp. WMMD975]